MLIFFTQKIEDFKSANGMNVSPRACEKTDNTAGFYLGEYWKSEVEAKGATVEVISKDDLKFEDVV